MDKNNGKQISRKMFLAFADGSRAASLWAEMGKLDQGIQELERRLNYNRRTVDECKTWLDKTAPGDVSQFTVEEMERKLRDTSDLIEFDIAPKLNDARQEYGRLQEQFLAIRSVTDLALLAAGKPTGIFPGRGPNVDVSTLDAVQLEMTTFVNTGLSLQEHSEILARIAPNNRSAMLNYRVEGRY